MALHKVARIALLGISTFIALVFATGCSWAPEAATSESGLPKVSLQLDWLPEAAHGGFYQAVLDGTYEKAGLEVEIVSGGPSTRPLQNVALGKADFGIARLDEIVLAIDKGIPLAVVASFKQHDPQGIMVHKDDPAQSLADLDGRNVMTLPGSAMILWLEKHYGIKLNVIPLDYGVQRFAADPTMIQQCFVNSQPFYLEEMDVPVRTFLFSESGFDPGRVIYCNTSLLKKSPELVGKFIKASLDGWNAYMYEDRTTTDAELVKLNPRNTPELNAFTVEKSKELHIYAGRPELGLAPGALPIERVAKSISVLGELDLIKKPLKPEDVVPYEVLPGFVKEPDMSLKHVL